MQEAVDTILKFVFVQCPKKFLSSAIFRVTWQSQKQRITKTDSVRKQKSVIVNDFVIVTQITKCTIIRNPVRKNVFPGCNDNGPTLFKNDIIDENDDAVVARKIRETDIVFFPPSKKRIMKATTSFLVKTTWLLILMGENLLFMFSLSKRCLYVFSLVK